MERETEPNVLATVDEVESFVVDGNSGNGRSWAVVIPRSDRKALSGVSDWVDSTQSLVPGLYWKTSPWYNLNCTKGLGGIHPVPET